MLVLQLRIMRLGHWYQTWTSFIPEHSKIKSATEAKLCRVLSHSTPVHLITAVLPESSAHLTIPFPQASTTPSRCVCPRSRFFKKIR